MRLKIALPLVSAVLLGSMGLFSIASAQGVSAGTVHANADIELGTHDNATSTAAQAAVHGNATSTDTKTEGQLTAESHQSIVASFVKTLLNVANREGGIGAQVRTVAMAQQDSASTSAQAIAKVEAKNSVSTFLFGSDYHSLGQLRSEMVTTQNNIDQLKALLSQTANATDKADLEAQIKVLEDSQSKIDVFVQAHENSFSIFGWFTRRFFK